MALAVAEAAKAVGRTHPNPAVGAVIVRGDRVVGRGFTSPPGGPHAEIHALREAGKKAKGATLYCTLEPCAHHGRTGPCTEAILAAGIKRVVFATNDPNPLVNGKGERWLRAQRVVVTRGVLRDAAEVLNRPFLKFMQTGLPWVTLKAAITLDGKIATSTGESKWISSEASRVHAHQLRNVVDAIIVGAGTVEADDPLLTTRLPGGRHALRVVLDARLTSSAKKAIFDTKVAPTLVITEQSSDSPPAKRLRARGVEVMKVPGSRRNLEPVLGVLAERGALHVMVEGGAGVHQEFLKQGCFDELLLFLAPTVFGHDGLTWTGLLGVTSPTRALRLKDVKVQQVGDDVMVSAVNRRT
jgi:diaminohydroxyphosphoribosylaminopyrimidine deaminase/5-amino-6-(5-phosphoribosylamino)uracil reductase